MSILDYILEKVEHNKIHFSLIDPDKQDPRVAGEMAAIAEKAGSMAIMVGGSTLGSIGQVDKTIKNVKNKSDLPVILFPSSAKFLSKYADAMFFMSLLNSRNLDFVIREHVKGAHYVKKVGIEPISMGYLIIEPGMTAGRIGEVDLVGRGEIETAAGYGLASQYLGMSFFYLEAGSGAPVSVPNDMISTVKNYIDIPLVVGGGIKDVKTAREKAKAGADIIVTGTTLEEEKNLEEALSRIIKAVEG